jgi:hypothetical protein
MLGDQGAHVTQVAAEPRIALRIRLNLGLGKTI